MINPRKIRTPLNRAVKRSEAKKAMNIWLRKLADAEEERRWRNHHPDAGKIILLTEAANIRPGQL